MRMKVTTALSPTSAIVCTLAGRRDSFSFESHAMQMATDLLPGLTNPTVPLENLLLMYSSPCWAGLL
jgi:hypothetical protein